MSRQPIAIPKVMDKITLLLNSAIRDAMEHIEDGRTVSDEEIREFGEMRMYDDGHKVYTWKGKDVLIFYPMTMGLDQFNEPELTFSFEKLYEDIE